MSLSVRTILVTTMASIAVATGASVATAPAAWAGSYTVYGCRTPSGAAAPLNGWHGALDPADNTAHEFWGGTCPGPWYLKLDPFFSHIDGAYAKATFIAPADTTIGSYSIWRAVRLVPSAGYVYQLYALSAGRWVLMNGCTTSSACGTYGNAGNLADPSNLLHQSAPVDTTELQFRVMCTRSGGCPSVGTTATASDAVWMWSSAISLVDDSSPQFSPSGPLVAPRTLSGVVPVSVAATDRGSGLDRATIEVDGQVKVSQSLGGGSSCKSPFVATVPCPLSASGTLSLNTKTLADGAHSLRLLVSDAAGNTAAWGPITIRTANTAAKPAPSASSTTSVTSATSGTSISSTTPNTPTAPSATTATRRTAPIHLGTTVGGCSSAGSGLDLRASFKLVKRRRVRVHKRMRWITHARLMGKVTSGYRHPPAVVGTLKTAAGAPVAGVGVCVAVRDDHPGAPLIERGMITTNATGGFRFQPGRGPSRTLYFIHHVPGGVISTAVHLAVRVPVKVHVNAGHLRNGQVMTLRGRLPRPVPEGLLALIQVWRGTYWQVFETATVHRSGAWVARYRFRRTTGVQHYRFRVMIRRQSGYPYAAGASRSIRMTVTGR